MRRVALVLLLVGCKGKTDEVAHVPVKHLPPVAEPDPDPAKPRMPDPMPAGADPLYPTARRAGTEDLFFLEEPLRGPHVTQLAMPDRAKLTFDVRAYCEIDELTVVCDHDRPNAKDLASVNVGLDHGRPVLVEWKLGKHVDQTVVLSYNAAGDLERMSRIDETGTIDWVRTYAPAGKRYTARLLSGANALAGCGSMELTVDNGRATATTCLQWLGDEMRDTNGVVRTEFERDVDGFVIAETRQGFAGRLVDGVRDHVHHTITTRDSLGRPTRWRFEAIAGHPVGSADQYGCAGVDVAYEKNLEHLRTCIDEHGDVGPDEDGVTITESAYDRQGCLLDTSYLDAARHPAGRDGVHGYRNEVDARCDITASACVDLTGAKVACAPGAPAEYRYVLDAQGHATSTTFRNADGSVGTDANYGVNEMRKVYDELGRQLEEACFDATGAATQCGTTGFHRDVDDFDTNGRILEERFFDELGNAATNQGTAARRNVYDNYDHLSESQDYDANGNLFQNSGMAIRRQYYDDSHRLFGVVLLDAAGQPAMYDGCYVGVDCPLGADGQYLPWHAVRLMRSPAGRVISNVFFDAAGAQLATVDCKVQQCFNDNG